MLQKQNPKPQLATIKRNLLRSNDVGRLIGAHLNIWNGKTFGNMRKVTAHIFCKLRNFVIATKKNKTATQTNTFIRDLNYFCMRRRKRIRINNTHI